MLKTTSGKPKPKPRPKKPGKSGDGDANDESENSQKVKRRRPSSKKKDVNDADSASPHRHGKNERKGSVPPNLQFLQRAQLDDRIYERAPRLLPEIPGVKPLSGSEIQSDIKRIQLALSAFESKVAALLPPGSAQTNGSTREYMDDMAGGESSGAVTTTAFGSSAIPQYMVKMRRARANGVITPEEVVETLPACRRAVRITQRELAAMKRERDDLERDFMRLRSKFVWQVAELRRMQKQQNRIMRILNQDVAKKAKSLESSRRRTSALQDIMNELEVRGSTIVRLTREKHQLETLLGKHGIELPEIEEVYVGDRVECPFGRGQVRELNEEAHLVVVDLDKGGCAYVQEEFVEVLPSEITYLEQERQLKQRFFDKIGALVQPNGKFSLLAGLSGGRRRGRGDSKDHDGSGDGDMYDMDDDDDEKDEDDEEVEDEDEDSDDSQMEDQTSMDRTAAGRRAGKDDGGDQSRWKKRRLVMMPPPGTPKKKQKHHRVIEFSSCTIPITPYDTGLLLSPLSALPERVAAVGPNALQWLASYLPKHMYEWEQERYESLQMKGEVERLRFQLQRAEAEKLDAQQHASDQLESINQLVAQLDKLRESVANGASMSTSATGNVATSVTSNYCTNCGSGGSNSRKNNNTSSSKGSKSTSKANNKKENMKRQRTESIDENTPEDSNGDKKAEEDEKKGGSSAGNKSSHDDGDDDAESSDGNTSSKPATRSLRPRRPTTASPKQTK